MHPSPRTEWPRIVDAIPSGGGWVAAAPTLRLPYAPLPTRSHRPQILSTRPEPALNPSRFRFKSVQHLFICSPAEPVPSPTSQANGPADPVAPDPILRSCSRSLAAPDQPSNVGFPSRQQGSPSKPPSVASPGLRFQVSGPWSQPSPARGLLNPGVSGPELVPQPLGPASSGPNRRRLPRFSESQAFPINAQPADKP